MVSGLRKIRRKKYLTTIRLNIKFRFRYIIIHRSSTPTMSLGCFFLSLHLCAIIDSLSDLNAIQNFSINLVGNFLSKYGWSFYLALLIHGSWGSKTKTLKNWPGSIMSILTGPKTVLWPVCCVKVHIFWEGKISTLLLSVRTVDKSKVEISQSFVAFSEYIRT